MSPYIHHSTPSCRPHLVLIFLHVFYEQIWSGLIPCNIGFPLRLLLCDKATVYNGVPQCTRGLRVEDLLTRDVSIGNLCRSENNSFGKIMLHIRRGLRKWQDSDVVRNNSWDLYWILYTRCSSSFPLKVKNLYPISLTYFTATSSYTILSCPCCREPIFRSTEWAPLLQTSFRRHITSYFFKTISPGVLEWTGSTALPKILGCGFHQTPRRASKEFELRFEPSGRH